MPKRRRWRDRVAAAVVRVVRRSGRRTFSRAELVQYELDRIVDETRSTGSTPDQTLSRVRMSGEIRVVIREPWNLAVQRAAAARCPPAADRCVRRRQESS